MLQKIRGKLGRNEEKIQQDVDNGAFDHAVIAWEAPEYIKHERSTTWFMAGGIVTIMLVLWGIWTNSWSMAVAFLLLAGVYYLSHTHQPRQLKIIISEIGIKVGTKCYPYSLIKNFWIHYHPPFVKTLSFRTNEKMFKEIVIQLDGQDPVPIRTCLSRQISEWEGKEETFTDLFARIFKL